MSDALDYLLKARPEAMTHYFRFLKDAGSLLDPKTRNLISVITKVHAQTERGLKQYLKRALREGCTGAEVIDALLMAFPALGLTKIVWATDVILSMNLPEFELESLQNTKALHNEKAATTKPQWHDVLAVDALADGEVLRTEHADKDRDGSGRTQGLFIYRKGTQIQVYDSLCPHKATNIPELALAKAGKNKKGITLTCPKHEWQFDVESGACIKKGDSPLTRLESKVSEGRLWIRF